MCGAPLENGHAHVVDREQHRLLCSCRPCYLLFTHSGAGGGRFRSVAERVIPLPNEELQAVPWEALEIPVGVAFFLRDSARDKVQAFYPSPAGATEAGLALEIWNDIVTASPTIAAMEPDTEALLVWRRQSVMEAWIVAVDACYALVGRIRRQWTGFAGGPEAWQEIGSFFAELRTRERSCA